MILLHGILLEMINTISQKIIGFNKDPQNQNMTITRKYYEKLGNTYQPDSLYTNKNLKNTKEIKNVELI